MELKYNHSIKKESPLATLLKFNCFNRHEDISFNYSIYINGDPGMEKTESRDISKFSDLKKFYSDIQKKINDLKTREELAIHSCIKVNNSKQHFPLIDFVSTDKTEIYKAMEKLQTKLNLNCDIYIFNSGRSFHAYIDTLLTERQWHKFLGSVLLLNHPNHDIIDARWVGHSLRQGFSSLRLSCNTPLYINFPIYSFKIPKN